VTQEHAPVGEVRRAEEGKLAGVVQLDQPGQEQAAEQLPSTRTGSRNAGRDDIQRVPSRRDAAARHDHVHVRVMRHRRAPGVEHGGDADPRAQVLRVAAMVSIVSDAALNSRS
jgi:hypothetical protein